jgi:hypothetical protein
MTANKPAGNISIQISILGQGELISELADTQAMHYVQTFLVQENGGKVIEFLNGVATLSWRERESQNALRP